MTKFNLIPTPSDLQPKPGSFNLGSQTTIFHDTSNQSNARYLQQLLRPATGFPFDLSPLTDTSQSGIFLCIDSDLSQHGEEGYRIQISESAVDLRANTTTGIFYAIQTLRQLLPVEIESQTPVSGVAWQLPCIQIHDQPQFLWRGYMLDEARHFQGIRTVKKLLDQMALLKLNRFHWHLTDDQGWRIEINQYPLLADIGSWRAGSAVGNSYISDKHNQIPVGGCYTQEEIREVVAYALERHIMVIPEIEIPGHSTAALAAYPEFSCSGGPIEVATKWGVFPDIFCAGKPETLTFLKNVLAEVFDLFPAPFLHIGGDEAPKARWKVCPDCQRMITDHKLADEHALQVYLTNQIAAYAAEHGKRIIFWSDAFDPAIDPAAIVQFWVGKRRQVLESVRQGRELISSPYLFTYLDHSYATLPLNKTAAFNPIFDPILMEAKTRVLGFEGLMWGEWLPNYRRVEFQTFPRLIALAESGWRQGGNTAAKFLPRLTGFLARLDLLDIGYAPLKKANPPIWVRLRKYIDIPRPKKGVSLPVGEIRRPNLVEIPLGLSGKVYRSPMPYAWFDINFTTFDEYLESNIGTVVMLVEEGEDFRRAGRYLKEEYARNDIQVIHFPIVDFETPGNLADLKDVLAEVADLCRKGQNVAVHCYAGRGRTGMFIALLARYVLGMDGEEAINFVRRHFPAVENEAQEELVRNFEYDK